MIQLTHLSKSFNQGKSFIVNDVSFTIQKGETFVLLGSSGSGKTTLLKMINRLVIPTGGHILINKQDIVDYDPIELRRSMGYVFQKIGLFPHLSIEDNITIVLKLMSKSPAERKKRAYDLLNLIGMSPAIYAHRYPHELSGGQAQRVGVARALASDPDILLMDEPFGALDAITRNDLQNSLIELKKQMEKTIVFVTHDIAEAFKLADRIAVLHQGNLQQLGTSEEILNSPATPFVKQLLESTEHFEEKK